jgi:hypothetical protein
LPKSKKQNANRAKSKELIQALNTIERKGNTIKHTKIYFEKNLQVRKRGIKLR